MRIKHTLLLMVVIVTLSSFKDVPKEKTKVKPKSCTGLITYVMTFQWNDSVVVGLMLEDRKEIVIKTKIKGYTPAINELYKFDCELISKVK
jgi:hypothetical protein